MNVDAVLMNLEERDKWRQRLALLEHTLTEIRGRKGELQARLKRIRGELKRLSLYSDAVLDHRNRTQRSRSHGASDSHLLAR